MWFHFIYLYIYFLCIYGTSWDNITSVGECNLLLVWITFCTAISNFMKLKTSAAKTDSMEPDQITLMTWSHLQSWNYSLLTAAFHYGLPLEQPFFGSIGCPVPAQLLPLFLSSFSLTLAASTTHLLHVKFSEIHIGFGNKAYNPV